MGNQSSKPTGPASPAANHSHSSSTANSRKELRAQPSQKSHNAIISPQERPSHTDIHSHSANSSPSQRHPPNSSNMGNEQSRHQANEVNSNKREKERKETRHGKSVPVKVPRGADPKRQRGPDSQFEPSGPPRDPNYIPHSNLNFPPRLPLPIEEEVHVPGSPVLTAQDFTSSLNDDNLDGSIDGGIPRQSSAISSTTLEEDAAGDELQPFNQPGGGTVPTLLQWKQDGEKVYVTGTFAGWSKKFRLYRE